MTELEHTIAVRLKALMRAHDIDFKEFARSIGRHPTAVIYWLDETKTPSIEDLVTIAKRFRLSIDWLCGIGKAIEHDEAG